MRPRRDISRGTATAWWFTLAAGVAVLVVVWALLEALRRAVLRIDERVTAVWTVGKHLAQNTQAGHLITTTKTRAADLAAEAERQRAALEEGRR